MFFLKNKSFITCPKIPMQNNLNSKKNSHPLYEMAINLLFFYINQLSCYIMKLPTAIPQILQYRGIIDFLRYKINLFISQIFVKEKWRLDQDAIQTLN